MLLFLLLLGAMESSGVQALPAPLLGPTPDFAQMRKVQLMEQARALDVPVRRRSLNSKGLVHYTWRTLPDVAADCLQVWKKRRLAEQLPRGTDHTEEPQSSGIDFVVPAANQSRAGFASVRKDTSVHSFWARMFGSPPADQSATLQEPGSASSHIAPHTPLEVGSCDKITRRIALRPAWCRRTRKSTSEADCNG